MVGACCFAINIAGPGKGDNEVETMTAKSPPTAATVPMHGKPPAAKAPSNDQAPAPEPRGVPMPLVDGPEVTIEKLIEGWDAMTDEEREQWGGR